MRRILSLLCVVIAFGSLASCATAEKPHTAAQLLGLGEKYLLELDYEQAVVEFTKLIEVEPMNPRGYTGAAEAYIALGEQAKAIEVLQRGMAVFPGDADMQAMLDELVNPTLTPTPVPTSSPSHAINPPFTLDDLEEWGYPHGSDIYDLMASGHVTYGGSGAAYQSFEEFEKNAKRNVSEGYIWGCGVMAVPSITIWNDDYLLSRVGIFEGDDTKGPRGISIGMTMEEVVSRFRCDNPEAIKFAQDPLGYSIPPANDESGWYNIRVYEFYDTGIHFGEIGILYRDGSIQIDYQAGDASLALLFDNCVVTSIWVNYRYPDKNKW